MPRGRQNTGRPGGRPKGARNKATIERELMAQRELEAERAKADMERANGKKLGKEMLDDFMHVFANMAAYYQPVREGDPIPPKSKPDPVLFEKWARLAVHCAEKLAPYQSPTFQAIAISAPPPEIKPGVRTFTLTIFESGPKPKLLLNGPSNGHAGNGRDAA